MSRPCRWPVEATSLLATGALWMLGRMLPTTILFLLFISTMKGK